jgi:hypothetical protein
MLAPIKYQIIGAEALDDEVIGGLGVRLSDGAPVWEHHLRVQEDCGCQPHDS